MKQSILDRLTTRPDSNDPREFQCDPLQNNALMCQIRQRLFKSKLCIWKGGSRS